MLMTVKKLKIKKTLEDRITHLLPIVVTSAKKYLQASSLEMNVYLWEKLMGEEYNPTVTELLDKRKRDRREYTD